MTVVVTIQGKARALKHARALSRPGKNGGAHAASRGTGLGNWKCSLFHHRCGVFWLRFYGAFAARWPRRGCALATPLVRLWRARLAASLLRKFLVLCHAFGSAFAALLLRLWGVCGNAFAASVLRLRDALAAFLPRHGCGFRAPS